MADKKSNGAIIAVVTIIALLLGVGAGYLVATRATCDKEAATAPQPQAPAPAPEVTVDSDRIAQAVVAKLDEKLENRLKEVQALEAMAADLAKKDAPAKEPKAVRPAPKPAPKPAPEPPQPAPRPEPPRPAPEAKQVDISAKALARKSEYPTQLGPNPAIGPNDAPVKVFIISDFQCPVCRRAAEGAHELFDEFGPEVQWIFWHNPLDMHRNAMPTAKASMAAFKQGKFWEYHDLLFQNQRAAQPDDLVRYAQQLGLDVKQFQADMQDPELEKKLRSDQAAAENLGARGTPAFAINGRVQVGWGSAAGIGSMVKREKEAIEALTKDGMKVEEALAKRAQENAKSPEEAQVFIDHFLQGKPAARKADTN